MAEMEHAGQLQLQGGLGAAYSGVSLCSALLQQTFYSTFATQVVLLRDCCAGKSCKCVLAALPCTAVPSNISDSIGWMLSLSLDDSA